jgi:hypothetical protein
MPAVVTLATFALVVLVIAPAIQTLRLGTSGVGAPASPQDASAGIAASTCGPTQNQITVASCLLIPGTLVEIVGHDGGLMASTRLVRVQLESPKMSAEFGNPALFETDARTQIEPSAPTIAATGVKVGARVQVAFDGRAAKTASGAYLLTRFAVVSDGGLPNCAVLLDITFPPRPGWQPGTGAASAEDAFRQTFPSVVEFKMFPGGTGPDSRAPVWIVAAGGETYIAQILGGGDAANSWFAYPAKFVRCRDPLELRSGPPSVAGSPRAEATARPQLPAGPISVTQVAAGMPAGAAIFAQTAPTCARDADGKTYRCTLASAPAPETSDFLGTKEPLVIAGFVAGGCIGLDHAGMTWNCFIGQDAVDQGIIGKEFLGQPGPVPGRG